jgi:hypothetical protein
MLLLMQIVGSMSPPSAVGRAPLSTRFTARVRILSMTFPEKDALQAVYTAMVQRVSSDAQWKTALLLTYAGTSVRDPCAQSGSSSCATTSGGWQNSTDASLWAAFLSCSCDSVYMYLCCCHCWFFLADPAQHRRCCPQQTGPGAAGGVQPGGWAMKEGTRSLLAG